MIFQRPHYRRLLFLCLLLPWCCWRMGWRWRFLWTFQVLFLFWIVKYPIFLTEGTGFPWRPVKRSWAAAGMWWLNR
ncbi:MAG TPA: hypothetical protein DCP37_01915 [Dehalococcoidia bacterium]|nr:hypothetical protein [Dehalococcoidia bacterium]